MDARDPDTEMATDDDPSRATEPIAIVGLSGTMPGGASSLDAFWEMLCARRSACALIPAGRFNGEAFYDDQVRTVDSVVTRHGYFIERDPADFDAPFFGISPAEAACLDPQQRVLLEGTFHALENAGISVAQVAGSRTSVHIASFTDDFLLLTSKDPELQSKYAATGLGPALLANRISHFFDLRGPSLVLNTACSSSLYALHLACQGLRSGETDLALVGGAIFILTPDALMVSLSNAGYLSPDGRCHSFDAAANGYARGEGTGMLALKRLSDALRDGNPIRAIVRATGANQDGRTPSVSQPSAAAQRALIHDTYASAGLSLRHTRFVEAHGTGTPVGDPIEANAIGGAFRSSRTDEEPLIIGALKASIGHLEGASGIAALIKTIKVLETGLIPPNAEFESLNPAIDAQALRLHFPKEVTPWPVNGLRRASINNFGYGGSNGHVVLDDAYHFLEQRALKGVLKSSKVSNGVADSITNGHANGHRQLLTNGHMQANGNSHAQVDGHSSSPNHADVNANSINGTHDVSNNHLPSSQAHNRPHLLALSAADKDGLQRQAQALQEYFTTHTDKQALERAAYTLSEKRTRLPWRGFALASDAAQASENLSSTLSEPVRTSTPPRIAFVFTGQGAQWARMGLGLMQFAPVRRSLEAADAYLKELGCGWSLLAELGKDGDESRVGSAQIAQPACTALQIALVELFRSWNVEPATVVGHSSGEIAAAYCAELLSFEAALKAAYFRGQLAQKLMDSSSKADRPRMGMMAVTLSSEEVLGHIRELKLADSVFVGCLNGPANTTVTGLEAGIETIRVELEQAGILARKIAVSLAYHSKLMQPIADDYFAALNAGPTRNTEKRTLDKRDAPVMYSSVTGAKVTSNAAAAPGYWVDNLLSQVDFLGALTALCRDESANDGDASTVFIEVGPSAALQRPIAETVGATAKATNFLYHSALRRNEHEPKSLLEVAGALYSYGHGVCLHTVNSADPKNAPQMLTDLPAYRFSRPQKYWFESRISKNYRFNRPPRQALLGVQTAHWNPAAPLWRLVLRPDLEPWVNDHRIGGALIYPAGGLLCMVIEGARQLVADDKMLTGFHLRDVHFSGAVVVDSTDLAEIQLAFSPLPPSDSKGQPWFQFRLSSVTGQSWKEVGRGRVWAETGAAPDYSSLPLDAGMHGDIADRCFTFVHRNRIYESFSEFGFGYGPSFQVVQDATFNYAGEVAARVALNESDRIADPTRPGRSRVVHPAVLDGVLQLLLVALSEGGAKAVPPVAASRMNHLWLSAALIQKADTLGFNIVSRIVKKGFRDIETNAIALDDAGVPVLALKGNRATAVESFQGALDRARGFKRLCSSIVWLPSVSLHAPSQLQKYIETQDLGPAAQDRSLFDKTEALCLYFFTETAGRIDMELLKKQPGHLGHYVNWLQKRATNAQYVAAKRRLSLEEFEDMAINEELLPVSQRIVMQVGRQLLEIFEGKLDPLQILFSGDLAQDYYDTMLQPMSARLGAFVGLMSHENPGLKLLEVGAGVGSATGEVLSALTYKSGAAADDVHRYSEYVYTDISSRFFEGAQERFSPHRSRMRFAKLDIGRDPAAQGFDGDYDVVVASAVLHATPSLHETLVNVRKLLKPGGRLMFVEICNTELLGVQFWTGLLPGWWLSTEEYRKGSPLVDEAKWDQLLRVAGFDGIEVAFKDTEEGEYHGQTAIIAKALPIEPTKSPIPQRLPATIVIDEGSDFQLSIAKQLQSVLKQDVDLSCSINMATELAQLDLIKHTTIFLPELEREFLGKMNETAWDGLKNMCLNSQHVFWFSRGAGSPPTHPGRSMVTGLARSLCSETGRMKIVTLGLHDTATADMIISDARRVIQHALTAAYTPVAEGAQVDFEYVNGTDGLLHIGRVAPNGELNETIVDKTSPPLPTVVQLRDIPNPNVELQIATPGRPESLYYGASNELKHPLADDEIEVTVHAAGVDARDGQVAQGLLTSRNLGLEAAGIVSRTGGQSDFQVGDKVMFLYPGGLSTALRLKSRAAVGIPKDLAFADAASIPVAFVTAWHALTNLAHLALDEIVLIRGGASPVGQAALQVAKMLGAHILLTTSTPEESSLLGSLYGIPSSNIFTENGVTGSVYGQVMAATARLGADVVIHTVNAHKLTSSLDCVASFGRIVNTDKSSMDPDSAVPMAALARNMTFASVDLEAGLFDSRYQRTLHRELTEVVKAFARQDLKVVSPISTFPASDTEGAFRHVQDEKMLGKVVIEFGENTSIPVLQHHKPTYAFKADGTYMLAGGLGGLGQNVIRWLIYRGARNFLILSRSGAAKNATGARFIKELSNASVRIEAPACDISNLEAVKKTLSDASQRMPPIRGCFQTTMVLHHETFEALSLPGFQAALTPKVAGTWNLHDALPTNLDFFVLFSSFGGIHGNIRQSNYSVANNFQDAFARYRTARGQACVAVALGVIGHAGRIATNLEESRVVLNAGYNAIEERQFLAVMDTVCDPTWPVDVDHAQVVLGVDTHETLRARGVRSSLPWMGRPFFSYIDRMGPATGEENINGSADRAEDAIDWRALVDGAADTKEAGGVVVRGLVTQLARTLCIDEADVDVNRAPYALGVDSLIAMDIRTWFAKALGAEVPVFNILKDWTVSELCLWVAQSLEKAPNGN